MHKIGSFSSQCEICIEDVSQVSTSWGNCGIPTTTSVSCNQKYSHTDMFTRWLFTGVQCCNQKHSHTDVFTRWLFMGVGVGGGGGEVFTGQNVPSQNVPSQNIPRQKVPSQNVPSQNVPVSKCPMSKRPRVKTSKSKRPKCQNAPMLVYDKFVSYGLPTHCPETNVIEAYIIGWLVGLCCLMTPGLSKGFRVMYDCTFLKLANHQIRH